MLVFVLNQTQKANTGKIQTPVYENVREFGTKTGRNSEWVCAWKNGGRKHLPPFRRWANRYLTI